MKRVTPTHLLGREDFVLMHQGIGLDGFNNLSRSRAVHALYECCCNVTWAGIVADARPFDSHDALLAKADVELLALSQTDLDRSFDSCHHGELPSRTVESLAKVTRDRVAQMLGPEGGYPDFAV